MAIQSQRLRLAISELSMKIVRAITPEDPTGSQMFLHRVDIEHALENFAETILEQIATPTPEEARGAGEGGAGEGGAGE